MFGRATHAVDLYDNGVVALGRVYGFVTRPVRWQTDTPEGQSFTVSDAAFMTQLWPRPSELTQGYARVSDLALGTAQDYDIKQVSVAAQSWTMTLALDRRQVAIPTPEAG